MINDTTIRATYVEEREMRRFKSIPAAVQMVNQAIHHTFLHRAKHDAERVLEVRNPSSLTPSEFKSWINDFYNVLTTDEINTIFEVNDLQLDDFSRFTEHATPKDLTQLSEYWLASLESVTHLQVGFKAMTLMKTVVLTMNYED